MKNEEKETIEAYKKLAMSYHKMRTIDNPKGWFFNEHLEMPATLELLGNVKGKKILDMGCGTGIWAKLLTKKGANVRGFDISPEMIEIAKCDNPSLDLRVGSVYKIPFNENFDIVLGSLMVHYIEDWDKMFREVKKVLKKGGLFIFSTGNPITECSESVKVKGKKEKVFGRISYFDEKKMYLDWKYGNNKKVSVHFHHRTYETIIKTIIKNDFEIVDYKDAKPTKQGLNLFPDKKLYAEFPLFNVWKVKKK